MEVLTLLFTLFGQVSDAFKTANLVGADLWQVTAFFALSLVGVVIHFLADVRKQLVAGGVKGLLAYLFIDHLSASLTTAAGLIMSAIAWFAINPPPAPWPTLIFAAVTAGYTFDSLLNKGKVPEFVSK